MSYNGSGTFQINTSGQPVVTGTSISSTVFNALTADLATGLSTAITKDGQTTTTARIPFALGINSTLVTDATNTTSGSIITAGGVGIAKNVYVGSAVKFVGATSGSVGLQAKAVAGSTTFKLPSADGTSNQAMVTDGSGNLSFATVATTPGGSTTQVQYNNAGAFGGISGVTTDGTRMTASTTIGVGAATPSTSGAGITFPATQSASTDANTLDDYEEGTWTPSVGGTATYTTRNATYTKIGRNVTIWANVVINAIGTGSSSIFTGNPFAPGSSSANYFTGTVYWDTLAANQINLICIAQEGGSNVFFAGAAASTASINNVVSILGNGTLTRFNITYMV